MWIVAPERGPAAASRYVRGFLKSPDPLYDGGAFAARLVELAGSFPERPVLVPLDDAATEAISRAWPDLAARSRPLLPDPALTLALLDKRRQYELVRAAGIPLPRTWDSAAPGAREEIRATARFPVLVKPRFPQAFRGRERVKVLEAASFAELLPLPERFGSEVLVQERVPGPVWEQYEHCTFVDAAGRVAVELVVRKLDEHPRPHGTATALETVRHPGVSELGRRLLHALDFRGISHAEFKVDPETQELLFIEMNPRLPLHATIQLVAGADTLYPAYAEAVGVAPAASRPRATRTVWLRPEVRLGNHGALRSPRAPAVAPTLPGPTRYASDLLCARDPAPLLVELTAAARRRVARGRARLAAAAGRIRGTDRRAGAADERTHPARGPLARPTRWWGRSR